jgi:diguanylate cyclase (GGDEF)-like protein/PAS domain S-box-containing protein
MFDLGHLLMRSPLISSIFIISVNCLGQPNWILGVIIVLFGVVAWQSAWLLHQRRRFRQILEQLQLSEECFRRAFIDAPVPVMLHTEDGEIIQISSVWTELTGYTLQTIPTIADWTQKAYGDRHRATADITDQFNLHHHLTEGECIITTASGEERTWQIVSAALSVLSDGRRLNIITALDVTERKYAEITLQESEERLRSVLEAAKLGTWYYDIDSQTVLWSERCREVFGLTSAQSDAAIFENCLQAGERNRLNQAITHAITNYEDCNIEYRIVQPDGSVRWLAAKGCAFYTSNGEPTRVLGVALDITESKLAEAALKQTNEILEVRVAQRTVDLAQANSLLQATLEATAEGILVVDSQGKNVNFNTRFVEMWQFPDSVVEALRTGQDQPMLSFTLSQLKDPEPYLQATSQMLADLESETFDVLELKDDRVFERYSRPQWLGDRCIGKVLSFQDITERRQTQASLQLRSHQQAVAIAIQQEIAAISPNLHQVMAVIIDRAQQLTDADGAVIEMVEGDELVYRAANGTATQYIGLRLRIATSLSGRCVETGETLYCNDTETDHRVDKAACRLQGIRSMVVIPFSRLTEKTTGVLKVFSATDYAFTEQSIQTLQLITGFLSNALHLAGMFQDKESLLTALQISEERYCSVITAMAEGVVLQNADGTICTSNTSAEQILSLSTEQIIGRSSLDLTLHTIHEDGSPFPGEQHPAMVTLQTGEPCRNVVMGVSQPNGQFTWISINAQPLFHPNQPLPYAVVTSFSDITERKRAQEQVQLLQILALTVGRSSDFNSALEQVLRLVCQTTGWNYGEAWIVCSPSNVLQCSPAYYINRNRETNQLSQLAEFRASSQTFSFPLGVGLPGRVWASQQPEWQEDVSQQTEHGFLRQEIALQTGMKTAFGVPVIVNDRVLAVLVFFKLEAVREDTQLVENLAAIAAQLGGVLQRKQIEVALQESEERFQAFMSHSPAVAFMKDETGHLVYVNEIFERLFNKKSADLIGKTDFDFLSQEIANQVRENDAVVLSTGQVLELVETIPALDGELHSWLTFKFPFQDSAGRKYVGGVAVDITDRKQAEIALQQSEIRYRAIVEDQTELITRYLADGTVTFANQAYALYFGRSLEELIGSRYQPMIFEADRESVEQLVASMSPENPVVIIENRVIIGDEVRWTQWHNRMLLDDQGRFIEFQSVGRDITALKQTEETLFQEKELAQVTLQSIGDAVITTDATGKIEYLNPVAESLTGWSESAAQGLPLVEVFRIVNETTRESVQNPIEEALRENRIVGLANHTVLMARNGQEIAIGDSAAPIRNREGQVIGAVMVFHDVTQTRALSRQLSWQASHDALTGLVNRREFERQVEQALRLAQLDFQTHALCYLDLDRFKIVNDSCGHAAGDELLCQVTLLLQAQIRKADTLARLGGDEFGVLLNQCSLEQALRIANGLRESVQGFRFVWQEQVFTIGVSIGLVGIDAHSPSFAEIISAADAACYTAKNRGRNRVYIAQTDDQELLQQRGEMQWVSRIAQAIENNWFCLYAQPIVAISPSVPNSDYYEVLLRLRDEQGNLVLPMAFIPAAERYNLMHQIDRWVIRTLFRNWSRVVANEQSIYAINLSGSSINDDQFIDFLHEQFALHLISPQHVCFEISETVAIANLQKTSQFIQELQRLGCRFTLDDFGAGMSSFAYLKSLPVDYLKIDGAFIRNIVTNSVDDAIITAITHISTVMGIRTIAEFVENRAILHRITAIGIDYAQGYGIAEPYPLVVSFE